MSNQQKLRYAVNIFKQKKELLRKYQMDNNIKGQCITNCQILLDLYNTFIKPFIDIEMKVKAVMVVCNFDDIQATGIVQGHLILDIDGETIEPSYEIFIFPKPIYFDNIKRFNDCVKWDKSISKQEELQNKKDTFSKFLDFKKIADEMNEGKFIIVDRVYYHNAIDYLLANKKVE
jgi:hypothetical protein